MLFEDQKEFYGVKEGDVPYVTAAFVVDRDTVGHVISFRRQGVIKTTVAYYMGEKVEVKSVIDLSPADFERFFAELTQTVEKNGESVVEFNYRTRTIDDAHTSVLMEEEYNVLTSFFLQAIAEGYERAKIYDAVVLKAREMRAQMH